ncbi:anti-repressor SinI family protein [Alicyclobacillus sp. ALC3]|uniref:anti-repressor SinI family protein n=1 Tax=Alicyclobacillus sp. ALC3 TaxID=2796143 RepID=UPI0023794FA4|nr:anti-repressor SinI family protein [Alicyclobacillus sp. ALC3]WDL99321.1 anti-repressor SinI family protein [Alicyclobacillus sp. ALC3]
MSSAEDDLVSYREDEVDLDDEWLVLILKAREAGLTPDDVRQFFRFRQKAV